MGDRAGLVHPESWDEGVDWQRRVVDRSLNDARRRSIDRGARLIRAAADVLERSGGAGITVQEVADEAGQSLRTLYQYFESKDDLLLAVFEEAMRTYARIVRAAIAEIEDPAERLCAGIIASVRVAALHPRSGLERGLSQLRLQLGQGAPASVARSQAPVTDLFRELVGSALAGRTTTDIDVERATHMISSLRSTFVMSMTLGNDLALEAPDPLDLSCFCLDGIGLVHPRPWHARIDARLQLVGGDGRAILKRLAT